MRTTTLGRRRLWSAPLLLAILAVTTAWTPFNASNVLPARAIAARAGDDTALAVSQPEAFAVRIAPRRDHPERTFAAPMKPVVVTVAAPKLPVSKPQTYSGRNHFWIPSLGVSQPVNAFPCSRSREPINVIYRWGCAGRNNVYLFGHAYGVMKALHDAYEAGHLHKGMLAVYADSNGNIRTYRVTTWRVVVPSNSMWAIADQPVPSMTLQTCLGALSQWRLNVRLVAVN